ncbi:hypothetical protein OU789_04215 [Halocynthiibacter sp. C4]|uniref:hypothetical protein n=1 Tax=Halocynthiibacter sp. C4 TaxID=2992758 RepID=UPI00237C4B0E|nr:hypothetical protein [Halocynthiibacter sp. C4]MDE0589123.1 hypothetical protein [Halocynthiibacter sp. C4]
MKYHISALLTLVLAIAFAIAPLLTSPFSGFDSEQLPIPQIDPPIQPAGYAFAIWGLIYIWLIVSAAFGYLKRREDPEWQRARLPLSFSLAIGVPWLAIANTSAIWATITIFLMALGTVVALLHAPNRDRWMFQAPVGIYAGWLTAATCVSLGTTMAGYGVFLGALGWTYCGISLGLIASVAVYRQRPNAPEYLIAVIWALVGILVANMPQDVMLSGFVVLGILVLGGLVLREELFTKEHS